MARRWICCYQVQAKEAIVGWEHAVAVVVAVVVAVTELV